MEPLVADEAFVMELGAVAVFFLIGDLLVLPL